MKILDLTGQKFGKLTAIKRAKNHHKYGQARWLVRCDCGTEKVIFGYTVVHMNVSSCGCVQKATPARLKHGMCRTPIFNSWASMRDRCNNENNKAFPSYGGRGIKVCERWDSFENFHADMGDRPEGTSLDRINNNSGYSPENCRWATDKQQVGNRRTTTFYTHDGVTKSLQEWGLEINVKYPTIWHRYKIGKRGHDLLAPSRYDKPKNI